MFSLPDRVRRILAQFAAAIIYTSLLMPELAGAVRLISDYSNLIDPNPGLAANNFRRGGIAGITGGVAFQGRAIFFIERGGTKTPVDARSVKLDVASNGQVILMHDGTAYNVETHPGLACPLSRLIQRKGVIAYTFPPRVPQSEEEAARTALIAAGVVRSKVAKEFDGTPFEHLLYVADFAETGSLDPNMERAMMDGINREVGASPLPDAANDNGPTGSYINSDVQIVYQVYLMQPHNKVDIAGVPLRYYWRWTPAKTSFVYRISVISQDFVENPALYIPKDGEDAKEGYSQYDVVVLYQTAGLFRQLHLTDPVSFGSFVAKVCGGRS